MKSRIAIFVVILLAVLLVLTACAKTSPASTPTSAPTSATATVQGSTSSGTASLDGKTILEANCQRCHGLAVVYGQQQGVDGWTQIVDNMIQRGVVLTSDERTALIAYLGATYK